MIRISKVWSILIFLTVLLPFWVVWNAIKGWEGIILFPLITSLLSSLMIAWIASGNKLSYMRLFFWIYVYIMFGIASIAQVSLNSWPWRGYYSNNQITSAFIIVWIGLLAYEIGYLVIRDEPKNNTKNNTESSRVFRQKMKPGISLAIPSILFASLTYIYLISNEVSLFAFRNDYTDQILELVGTVGYAFVLLLTRFMPLVTLLWVISEVKSFPQSRLGKTVSIFTIGALLIILLVSSNPIVAPRWWFSSVVISIFLLFLGNSKKSLYILGLGLPIIYTLVFPYLDLFRTQDTLASIFSSSRSDFLNNLLDGDYDSLQQIMNTIQYVELQGLSLGRQFLGVVAYWIPRDIWIDKPLDSGLMVSTYLGYSFTNLSSPIWAEGYINFGIMGTGIFLGVWGLISRALDKMYSTQDEKDRKLWLLTIFFLLVPAQNLLIRGSLLVATLYILSPILILFFWDLLNRIFLKISSESFR